MVLFPRWHGSGCSAIYDETVVPNPVFPSSEDSLELGSQPSARAPQVSGFDDDPPGMVSSSGDDSEDENINRMRRESIAAQVSSAALSAPVET